MQAVKIKVGIEQPCTGRLAAAYDLHAICFQPVHLTLFVTSEWAIRTLHMLLSLTWGQRSDTVRYCSRCSSEP